jgi:hypothetical protein
LGADHPSTVRREKLRKVMVLKIVEAEKKGTYGDSIYFSVYLIDIS